jgi:tetraprenyl-beta-curcumene synthase
MAIVGLMSSTTGGRTRRHDAARALGALARANLRYWPTVAPLVHRELGRWEGHAAKIGDGALRQLACEKLREERFNAEVAATLATLAPRRRRAIASRAIVALELLFDYLDGRTELPCEDPIAERERLFAPFRDAVDPGARSPGVSAMAGGEDEDTPDGAYLRALSAQTRESLFALPAASQVQDVAQAAAARCATAQTRLHAAVSLGDGQVQEWAHEAGRASGLGWREYAGGCASSVLSMHALIAAAADPATSAGDAQRIDEAYLAIGGVITTLDSLVDEGADAQRGESGFTRLFETPEQLASRLIELTREAHARALLAPHGAHHAMTLAGVIAYYTTDPGAREGHARGVALALRRELAPTIWPTLAVMAGWRAAKRARALAGRHADTAAGASSAADDSNS